MCMSAENAWVENTIKVKHMLTKYGIELSKEDYEIIDDIFRDNKINSVRVYTKNEYNEFLEDMVLDNIKELFIDGNHQGISQWSYTLVGNIEYGINDSQHLYYDDDAFIVLSDYSFDTIHDPNDMVITVIETVEWNTKGINGTKNLIVKSKELIIYVPEVVSGE